MKCSNCRYFAHEGDGPVGYCHRTPPNFHHNAEGLATGSWTPVSTTFGWCGSGKVAWWRLFRRLLWLE
jgi:hypothetical protein